MKLSIRGVEITIDGFTETDHSAVRELLQKDLADLSIKNRTAIKNAFAEAVRRSPDANPSDLWHHVVYRLYTELAGPRRSMADPGQSWKRASGDAFELFLIEYYNKLLAKTDVRLIALIGRKMQIHALKLLGIYGKVGDSKLDIAILGACDTGKTLTLNNGRIFGGIHAKVSLAERVSDDVPASIEMMRNGYVSYLATLDVKSFPVSETMSEERAYLNKGELGTPQDPTDKRKYIEDHGSFSACFSYNLRTCAGKKIFVGGLNGSWDALCDRLVSDRKKLLH